MYLPIEKFYPLLSAFVATVFFIFLLHPLAQRFGLMDKPDNKLKLHESDIPLTGGIAMMMAFILVIFWLGLTDHRYLLVVMALMCFVGLVDDFVHLSARLRLVLQAGLALLLVVFSGVSLVNLGNWFGMADIVLATPVSLAVTVFTIIAAMNAINMIDGIDGLAAAIVLNSLVWLMFMTSTVGMSYTTVIMTLIGCLFAYLLFNKPFLFSKRAKVFMGDAGSMMLGVGMAWLLITLSQPAFDRPAVFSVPVAVWLIAVPLLDTVSVTVYRAIKGANPFRGDRNHIHHILLSLGFSHTQVLVILFFVAFILNAIAVTAWWFGVPDWLMFLGFCLLFLTYFYTMYFRLQRRIEAVEGLA